MRPRQALQVLEDLRDSLSGPLYRNGVELSSSDNSTVQDVYTQWVLLLLDMGYLHPETLSRDAKRLLTDMLKADVLMLNNAFAELLALVRTQEIKGFKALCSRISTHLFNLVKDDNVKSANGDVFAARRLVQLFSYTGRLSLNDIDLTQQCLDDYMDTEANMPTRFPRLITSQLNKIVKRWFTSFDPDRITFGHGPGGVAGHGRTTLEVKYKDLTTDALLDYAFDFQSWTLSPIPSHLDRISQTIFVPKSYKTFRTISMESSTLQYCQQGVLGEINRVVESSRFLRARIGTKDQLRNQQLARVGSLSRNYATIDLSAASDSVSHQLVKEVFRGTKLLRYLIATRSPRTLLPDGRLVHLKKFAPMGSALCFPVETIIFAAICHMVTQEHDVYGDYSVYGDDIIVPTQCAEDVMALLDSLGFIPNRTKSFYDPQCWFRESCGGEYCDGFDVTPMRVNRKYAHRTDNVRLDAHVAAANDAYVRGFRYIRAFFVRKIQIEGYTALYAPTALLSDNYTNYHARRRWNPNFQRVEVEVSHFSSKLPENQDEHVRYRYWMEKTADRINIGDGFQSNVGKPIMQSRNRWLEKPYESEDQAFINFFTLSRE